MLLDRAQALRAELTIFRQAKAAGDQAKVYRTRARQFGELSSRLKTALACWTALKQARVPIETPSPVPAARIQAEQLRQVVGEDPASLATADSTIRFEFTKAIEAAAGQIETLNLGSWRAFVDQQGDMPRDEVLSALAGIASYRPLVDRIRRAAQVIANLRQAAPEPAAVGAAIAQLRAAGVDKDQAFAAMSADDLPPEVLGFLRAASQQTATLADYTDNVRRWLRERDLETAFRIVSNRA
jgi:hypothetical protein